MKFKFILGSLFLMFSFSVFADGKNIFDRYCTACHSPSMAPMFLSPAAHDKSAWDIRKSNALEEAIKKNPAVRGAVGNQKENFILEELILSAVNGTDNGMPPKGTCNDCTTEQIKSAIIYMSSEAN